jgi:hypothetical protein
MEDIQFERNSINEMEPIAVDAIKGKLTKGIVLDPKTQQDMDKDADDLKRDPKLKTMKPEEVVADITPDIINPAQKSKLDKAQQELKKDPELDEKRRRYSFVTRALPTYGLTPADRMRKSAMKAARRGLRGDR